MNFLEAQQEFADTLKNASSKVNAYFWQLSGDEPNILCRFLGVSEEELKQSLRMCKIYNGEKDKFSKNNFELTMAKACCDWTICRLNGTVERFIRIGKEGKAVVPRDMYDLDGNLAFYPVEDEHIRTLRTKSQKGSISKIVEAANKNFKESEVGDVPSKKKYNDSKVMASPKELLFAYVQELITEAVANGDGSLSERTTRRLQRMILCCVDIAAKELLQASLEKYASEKESFVAKSEQSLIMSPEKVHSSASAVATVVTPASVVIPSVITATVDNEIEVLNIDSGDEESTSTTTTTTDEFLSELKEEVILQCLLHKRIFEKKERVFDLVHRNGRRLLVVLPPDTLSVVSFEEEANKTDWVKIMLNSDERIEGMLLYLAKTFPDKYSSVGQKRKLSIRTVALDTAQTIALARVGRLNDTRMKKIRSFLRQVGKVNLQLSDKEQQRIDIQVGLHRTKSATFGSCLHEWSRTKGKEKKPPEQVYYWNSNLAHKVEAEVDLYRRHILLEHPDSTTIPVIDYKADGFDKAGITILFGGDHGDKHCPISCKLNLSPPIVRKEKKQLSYQCPVVTFASVQCTKDAYDLMDSTVMPKIKQQLIDLKKSSVVVVYHKKNITTNFRSYIVPSSIRPTTIAFLLQQTNEAVDDTDNKKITMTYAYGEDIAAPTFGSVAIEDPVFIDVPHFELGAKLIVSCFNELFIGDLAFLAMLIGMNNSSGSHCLMCMFKGAQFNCNHNSITKRTKESLTECLEEFMLLSSHLTRKAPSNFRGVNSSGLWDIDPQRIIIPILHCPMGLIDKILESFKGWVNLEVEDFHDDITEGVRSEYIAAKQEHDAAILTHKQRLQELANAINTPEHHQAKAMAKEADKARITARKAESKAKEQYDEQVQRHNAKKSSLNQQFEVIFRRNGVKREHYHGGKFNGVNCIRVMEKSQDLLLGKEDSPGFLQKSLASKHPTSMASEDTVRSTCETYARLLGLLDAIWSTVRGQDAGLLPSNDQKIMLQTALLQAKELWLDMKLSTLQPKWHLTFDGHLLEQFSKYGGLADKSDETIEKGHQTLKHLRERFRGISWYEQRETCIRRELRRGRSPEIQQHIDKYEAMIKQSDSTKRAADTAERIDGNKKAKLEKREAYITR
jgi:hypothetical protein